MVFSLKRLGEVVQVLQCRLEAIGAYRPSDASCLSHHVKVPWLDLTFPPFPVFLPIGCGRQTLPLFQTFLGQVHVVVLCYWFPDHR